VLRRILSTGDRKVYVVAVGRGDQTSSALAEATSAVERAASIGFDPLLAAHRAWWHQYYPASFLSVPDPRLEAFYWIQMYKLASAMRADGPIPGLEGPWFRNVPMNVIGWDLNVPLTYAPLFTANRLALGESLFTALDRNRQNLINNVPPALRSTAAAIGLASEQNLVSPVNLATASTDMQREIGNLPWAVYLEWKSARYRMDDAMLRDRVLPLLARSTAYYLSLVKLGPDGRYHLPPTLSPELGSVADASYDLALLRWSLQTLIDGTQRLRLTEPRLANWKEVLAHLAGFPINASGLMIGRGRPLAQSEPRFSHLLAISPLQMLNPARPPDRRLIEESLRNWESRAESFRGYSYAYAARLYAYLGDGDRALGNLHVELNRFVLPNTFDPDPTTGLAAPLAAASSVQDMLLQSWGGRLHVFPAMPAEWKNAAFANLRGEGAFLISAVWKDGQADWVRIDSQFGGPCRLDVPGWTAAVVRAASRPGFTPNPGRTPGEIVIAVPRGAWVVLAAAPAGSLPPVAPVAIAARTANPYPSPAARE
jgi:glycosyl hydrolase family 95